MGPLIFHVHAIYIKFQDSSISGSLVSQLPSITDRQTDGRTDGQTDGRTGPNQYAPSTSPELGA